MFIVPVTSEECAVTQSLVSHLSVIMSGYIVLLQLESVLMSLAHVATRWWYREGHGNHAC